jgi:hypothetical protein
MWAKKCEDRESMTPLGILDDLDMTVRTAQSLALGSTRVLWSAVHCDLPLYLEKCLDRDPSLNVAFWKGVRNKLHQKEILGKSLDPEKMQVILRITNILLAKGFNPNEILDTTTRDDNLNNKIAWQQFLQSFGYIGYAEVVKLLLLKGADPDVKIMGSDGYLYDVRQCLLASDWYQKHKDRSAYEREIDSWLAEARTRKAARSLKALEDVQDQNDSTTASLEPRSLTPTIVFICAIILAIYIISIFWLTFPFFYVFGFRWRPDKV